MSSYHQSPPLSPPFQPEPPAPQRRRRGLVVWGAAIFGVFLAVLALAVYTSRDDANMAKTGDCVTNNGTATTPDMSIVACADNSAEFKVIKVVPDTADTSGCQTVPGVQSAYTYQSKTKEVVLCLGPVR